MDRELFGCSAGSGVATVRCMAEGFAEIVICPCWSCRGWAWSSCVRICGRRSVCSIRLAIRWSRWWQELPAPSRW